MAISKDYLETMRERAKKSRVYRKYQETGLQLAEILEDKRHVALYIKLAKQHPDYKLLSLAKGIAEKRDVKNRGAYFMRVLFDGSTGPSILKSSGLKDSPQAGSQKINKK